MITYFYKNIKFVFIKPYYLMVNDDIELLENMVKYLKEYKQ